MHSPRLAVSRRLRGADRARQVLRARRVSGRLPVTGWPPHRGRRARAAGQVEVYYTEAMPRPDEGPFLAEERKLIDAIAERLGHFWPTAAAAGACPAPVDAGDRHPRAARAMVGRARLPAPDRPALFSRTRRKMINHLCLERRRGGGRPAARSGRRRARLERRGAERRQPPAAQSSVRIELLRRHGRRLPHRRASNLSRTRS